MSRVRIVTDSAADLMPAIAQELEITIVPSRVQVGDRIWVDGPELRTPSFYRRVFAAASAPKILPPTGQQFMDAYAQLAPKSDTILSIHTSGALDGAVQAVLELAREFPRDPQTIAAVNVFTYGMAAVAVTWGAGTREELESLGPAAVVDQAVVRQTKRLDHILRRQVIVEGHGPAVHHGPRVQVRPGALAHGDMLPGLRPGAIFVHGPAGRKGIPAGGSEVAEDNIVAGELREHGEQTVAG